MPLEIGTRLGPYEILAPLGAGGMGEVYRARDTRLDRAVAVKVLPSHLSANHDARQRFEREARAVSSLNHPHICTLHDIGSQDGVDFLVMEHLEGETLAARLQRGPLPPAELLRCATEVADALEKAHRQGLIHRDLKPGNVMLTKSGAKLLDFGLAKTLAAAGGPGGMTGSPTMTSPLTAAGALVGTFQYMAPEQLEGSEADARSDIFAFGMTLYEMATGKKAFGGKTQASLIASILKEEPQPISVFQSMTPPAIERLVSTCLAKDPEERRQTMHDVLLELRWIAEAGPQPGVPAVAASRSRPRERLLWFLVVLLGAVGVALGLAWHRAVSVEPRAIHAFVTAPDKTTIRSTGFGAGPVAVSPDGSRLVFAARREDGIELLWVRPLDSAVATPLVGTEAASYPFWSPDGRSIGFFAAGKLKRVDAAGGPALSLCDASGARGGAWNPEGVILFAPQQASGLFRVPAAGGVPVEVTKLDEARHEETHRWPQFLPGGRRFIFFSRIAVGDETNAVMAGSLDGGDARIIFRNHSNAVYASEHLLFMRDTTLMAQPFNASDLTLKGDAVPIAEQVQFDAAFSRGVFSASENGVLVYQTGDAQTGSQLIWFDRSGKQTGTLGDKALYVDFSISPDLKKVAVSVSDPRVGPPDLWIYEVGRGLRTRFTFDPRPDNGPIWSPDGSRVVFSSTRKGSFDLYIKSYAGSADEELFLETEHDQFPESWSSDGRYVAYQSRGVPGTVSDIWVLPLSGDRKPIPFLQTRFLERHAQFSPDGHWIAYISDESGRDEVYVAPFPVPGRKWQISNAGGIRPYWRQDGREIYYLAEDNRITAVDVGQQGATFEVGAAKPLFVIRPQRPGTIYRVSPEGQRFLVNTAVEEERPTPLTLVVNWTADLKQK